MDNYEEYLLRVLRRTNTGLQDSLIPAHAAKLSRLVDKLESTGSLGNEIAALKRVSGFAKSAVAMEWLLARAKRPEEEFSPEQFESDILLMNEKLFEAFLNQPFDMPDYNVKEHDVVSSRPIQKDVHISDDEFMLIGTSPDQNTSLEESNSIEKTENALPADAETVDWNPTISDSDIFTSTENQSVVEISPSLAEVVSDELLQSMGLIAGTAIQFSMKLPGERPVAMAVMRVAVKAAHELSQSSNNIVVQDFLQTLLSLISFADKGGKIRSDKFADIMHDVGDRLTHALAESSNGLNFLKNLTSFIGNPKELFSAR
ncbi:MAG: hypothetical protein WCT99_00785 [Bacteroidota bacterium]|jgi:hypothetical protein